ncbi:carboxynorspermidine decarboxylase [Veronia nyctiphanis]|uniref:Carboxynorspermidine/carboxyspermidine decarboxylase n=1 Tax=Veronia nyctiphanis TaxID=1278244 RepID=A0A4Q0YJ33_9GAMM|nr:carboxynorspermidine decarboxylase [Veronia nyctiphanis]RXJ70666.1 carboxynorspermidine decarboxylase [Veronia nyctiphanis]
MTMNIKRATHIFDELKFESNLKRLDYFQKKTGAKVLLALKGYNPHHSGELVSKYLAGVAVSSLYEAKSSSMHYDGEVHTYCPAYEDDTFDELASHSSHIVFNSREDLKRYHHRVPSNVKIDLRLNLEHKMHHEEIFDGYNPNLPNSRFGVTINEFDASDIEKYNISGFHFHALNSQGAEELKEASKTLIEKFGRYLDRVERINLGGGHLVCCENYDWDLLSETVSHLKDFYQLEVYIEPSQHVYNEVGVLKSKILSIAYNNANIAILDVSAKNHMPDILECPTYFAEVDEAKIDGSSGGFKYILAGPTCLSGDIIGEYIFNNKLKVGDFITFKNQSAYTFTQSTYFNGIRKPDMIVIDKKGNVKYRNSDSFDKFLSCI